MKPVRIAHISDLHFGGADNQNETWTALVSFLQNEIRPDLVLITGDVVDSPKTRFYEKAREALDDLCGHIVDKPNVQYFVCPGNHDRWRYGNAPFLAKNRGLRRWLAGPIRSRIIKAASEFDRIFQEHVPGLNALQDCTLGSKENQWNLRILGIDSSINADASARGFIEQDEIDALRNAMKDADRVDLGVLLIHHHILPVRSLEREREGHFLDLMELTPLVNAGTLVEALASAHIDIALHGHEHASNWGRYASLEAEGGETNVLGAASATGTITWKPCEQKAASFNVLELHGDRTVHLCVYRCDGARWDVAPQFQIYDSPALRRARFLRRAQEHIHRSPASDVTRFIDFTRERDGIVSETRTNIDFSKDPRVALQAENSTGIPVDLDVSLVAADGTVWKPEGQITFRSTSKQGVFDFDYPVPENVAKTLRRLEFSYRWFGGGLLTREEIEALAPGTEGEFRAEGFEFGAILIDGYFHTLRLIVRLPPEFAPAPDEIRGFVRNPKVDKKDDVLDQPDVLDCFRPIGDGLYSLVVPYPRRGFVYGINWRPPTASTSGAPSDGARRQFVEACTRNGDNLARVFHSGIENTPLANRCSISLYVPSAENSNLLSLSGVYPARTPVPPQVRTGTEAMPVTQAWRGAPIVVAQPPDPSYAWWDFGFMPQEKALMAIPVRFGIAWTNVAPWGVVRIGVNESNSEVQAMLEAADGTPLLDRLMRPMILMLGEARIGAE